MTGMTIMTIKMTRKRQDSYAEPIVALLMQTKIPFQVPLWNLLWEFTKIFYVVVFLAKLEFPQMNIETAKISTAERRFGMQAGIHGRRKSPQTKKRTKYQTCAEQEQAASQYESIESGDASEPKLISVRANRLKPVPDASLCVRQDRADS